MNLITTETASKMNMTGTFNFNCHLSLRFTREFERLNSDYVRSIRCIVNEKLIVGCYLLKSQEVLIPFELVRNYFKVCLFLYDFSFFTFKE